MRKSNMLNRRRLLFVKLVTLVSMGVAATGHAFGRSGRLDSRVRARLGRPSTFVRIDRALLTWDRATAREFSTLMGHDFSVVCDDHQEMRLKLVDVKFVPSGAARPKALRRSGGFTAVFESPQVDILRKTGHQTVNIWHHKLQSSRLFIGAVANEDGKYYVEAVLN